MMTKLFHKAARKILRNRRLGKVARKHGYEIGPFWSLQTVLAHHGINLVFDVGANVGQYARELRELGYQGKIVSFEPQAQPFAVLKEAAARDGNWTAVNIGLGSGDGQTTINLYSDSTLGSMLTLDESIYTFGAYQTGTEIIQIRRLDNIIGEHAAASDRIFLKIDIQGFEKEVLQGAEESLARLTGIQMEMSLTPIYADQPHLDEMIALLRKKRFTLWQTRRGTGKMEIGQELEIDGIFIKVPPSGEGRP